MIILIEKEDVGVCKAIVQRQLDSWEGSHIIGVKLTNENTLTLGYDAKILLQCYTEYEEGEYDVELSTEAIMSVLKNMPNGGIIRIRDLVVTGYCGIKASPFVAN